LKILFICSIFRSNSSSGESESSDEGQKKSREDSDEKNWQQRFWINLKEKKTKKKEKEEKMRNKISLSKFMYILTVREILFCKIL
jgi:hypothetical protein